MRPSSSAGLLRYVKASTIDSTVVAAAETFGVLLQCELRHWALAHARRSAAAPPPRDPARPGATLNCILRQPTHWKFLYDFTDTIHHRLQGHIRTAPNRPRMLDERRVTGTLRLDEGHNDDAPCTSASLGDDRDDDLELVHHRWFDMRVNDGIFEIGRASPCIWRRRAGPGRC